MLNVTKSPLFSIILRYLPIPFVLGLCELKSNLYAVGSYKKRGEVVEVAKRDRLKRCLRKLHREIDNRAKNL